MNIVISNSSLIKTFEKETGRMGIPYFIFMEKRRDQNKISAKPGEVCFENQGKYGENFSKS